MFKSVLMAAALSTVAVAAHAATERTMKVETAVSIRGVDFADPAQVSAFHDRLVRTAAEVCDSGMDRQLAFEQSDRVCAKAALDRAVAKIGQPMLTAYHEGKPLTANTLLAQR